MTELWARTLGDPRVKVAVLDGPADLGHPCFRGSKLSRLERSWRPAVASSDDYALHATHVASVIFGQHESEVAGVAPHCSGINVPIAVDEESVQCPLTLTRGIDAAYEAGANIVHVATCIKSHTGHADGLIRSAIRRCRDGNMLVVAPAGNDGGSSLCLPAALPEVLAVGALNRHGVPLKFSNWGGRYRQHGIVAPGEEILGAEPGGRFGRRRGTSCAAPIVTGVAALLMCAQLKNGEAISAQLIRDALLASALHCGEHDGSETGRCLAGKLNIPGALRLLFDPTYVRYRRNPTMAGAVGTIR